MTFDASAPVGQVSGTYNLSELIVEGNLELHRLVWRDRAWKPDLENGAVVEMTATEFDVLMCLVEARGKALTREHIFHKVWGPKHHGTPRTIDNFIQQLRAKLESDPQQPRHFLTVRGVGYRFEG